MQLYVVQIDLPVSGQSVKFIRSADIAECDRNDGS